MSGKIALVTGANKSIGLEAARGLAQLGMSVYLTSRDEAGGRAATEEMRKDGDVRYLHLDVTDEATMVAALDAVDKAHGKLDILINNAGVVALPAIDAAGADMEEIQRLLNTNLIGPMRLTQLALPLLRKSGAGRVVNVSSGASTFKYMSNPKLPRPYAYCLSKAAMNAATVLFASTVAGDGIKVNAVNPGYVYSAVSGFRGTRSPQNGAAILIKMATLGEDGPTGGFFDDDGPIAW
jgi:NAD(P)-dependent dehydrogenase (short-subunit alcohol dehydrogenase family)